MKHRIRSFPAACAAAAMILAGSASARAQITVAEGYTPPDDTPAVNVGGTIFANYTYQLEPTVTNSQGDRVHPSSFDVTRAYINVTGQINHLINFRITPDVVRVGQVDGKDVPGITGTLTYRLKYAYGQLNFSDFTTKGSWLRLGLQQTPVIEYIEGYLSLPLPGDGLRRTGRRDEFGRRRRVVPLEHPEQLWQLPRGCLTMARATVPPKLTTRRRWRPDSRCGPCPTAVRLREGSASRVSTMATTTSRGFERKHAGGSIGSLEQRRYNLKNFDYLMRTRTRASAPPNATGKED